MATKTTPIACSGCHNVIVDRRLLQCLTCMDIYDLLCANVTKELYDTLPTERKKTWICPGCVCRQTKRGDNTNTPIRASDFSINQTVHTVHDDESMDCSFLNHSTRSQNITFRRPQPQNNAQQDDSVCLDNIRILVREELQDCLDERLISLIGKAVENQIAPLVQSVAQLKTRVTTVEERVTALEERLNSLVTYRDNNPAETYASVTEKPRAQSPASCNATSRSVSPSTGKIASDKVLLPPIAGQIPNNRDSDKHTETLAKPASSDAESEGRGKLQIRPRKQLEVKRGTALPGTTCPLKASERCRYIHLFYVKVGTTNEQVQAYLSEICGEDVCTVETLKAKGNYASFKLTVPLKCIERVLDPAYWAEDICIKPWKQNFRNFRNKSTNEV
ncbi:uncharacterized protein LOC133522441 [Cydia pomonella]|uniref:uncharacterized protein LOC133522441 n=1 Tax=Cydia pomonella TaxID=82600 RepID=UPI002ADD68B9|nr:uncharacterized protein LOC133522441 [Cydia pomonella]